MITKYETNGKIFYQVFVKGRDQNGKQVGRRRKGIASKRKADEIEYRLKKQIESATDRNSSWTWDRWHEECLQKMRLELKRSTLMGYDGDLKKWLPCDWGERELTRFERKDIFELIYEDIGDKASANVKKNVLKKVRRIFAMAVDNGVIDKNPASGITVKVPAPQRKVLNSNEASLLLEEAKSCNHRFYSIWAFALFTGMRSGEMYALQWKDIDLETGLISVTKQWTSKDGLHVTKSNRNRIVPISPDLKTLLLEFKSKNSFKEKMDVSRDFNRGVGKTIIMKDLVLPRVNEWRMGAQAEVLRDFCRGIGITAVKFHDLRATFITNMLSEGVSLPKVMSIVGHSKMATTNEYLRLAGVEVKKDTTERLSYSIPKERLGDQVIQLFSS